MPKTSTGISIEGELINAFKRRHPNLSFSEYVESLVRKELGQVMTLSEIREKQMEAVKLLTELDQREGELLKREENRIVQSTIEQREELERVKKERMEKLKSTREKLQAIPEFLTLAEQVKEDPSKLEVKYLMAFIDEARAKYPDFRISARDIRLVLTESELITA